MKEYPRVCIVNNAYVLLQYFLLSSIDDIKNTYYFFAKNLSESIAQRFDHTRLCSPDSKIQKFFFLLKLKIISNVKWPFLKTAEIWGQDNLLITSPIIKDRKIILLEDGLLNYTFIPCKRHFKCLRRLLFGNLSSECGLGYSNNVDTIYLTGIKPIPSALKKKVNIINFGDIWEKTPKNKRDYICDIFSIKQSDFDFFRGKNNVLFTQPLSEDGIMPESEKISLYKKIVESIDGDVVIKSHPREQTSYEDLFPECYVFSTPIPLELLSLVGIKFKSVYTLFSSAALNIPYDVDIHWLGSMNNKYLIKKYGDTLDKCI